MCPQTVEALELYIEPDASLLLSRVSHILTGDGVKSYLTGGFVRDVLLKRDTADIDIAVDADALEVASRVAMALGGKYVPLDEVNGVGRVILFNHGVTSTRERWEIDFSKLKGNIEQDLAQRDFTVDAMAIDLEELTFLDEGELIKVGEAMLKMPALIDPFGGRDDLNKGILRVVADTAFPSDAARLLRAVRLAAELGFIIENETEALISRHSGLITGVAGERVREELLRLLALPGAGNLLAYSDEIGLLTAMIPEMVRCKGVEQPKEHFWDVFRHSLQTVVAAEFLLREGSWDHTDAKVLAAVPWSDEIRKHFAQEVSSGSTRKSLLKLAALLHDVAKPQTKTIEESGRVRFLGHGEQGAAIASDILERLRFSAKEIKMVAMMVKYHLRPTQMGRYELPTRRAIYRYFRDTGDTGVDILFLSLADHLAARGPTLDMAAWHEHTRIVEYVLAQRYEQQSLTAPPRLVDGNDLINIFNLRPGRKIGKILEAVREAQAAGELATREEAINHIERLLNILNSQNS